MARIFSDGFELGIIGEGWINNDTSRVYVSNVIKISGNYSLRLENTSSASISCYLPSLNEIYYSGRYYFVENVMHNIINFKYNSTQLGMICINNTTERKIGYYPGTSSTASALSTSSFPIGNYYHVEAYIKIDDSNGRIVVKVNGVTEIDYTGDTKPGADTAINLIKFGYDFTGSKKGDSGYYIDDIIFDNSTWIGNVKIYPVRIGSIGYYDGTAYFEAVGNSDILSCINEVPPNYNDYIISDTTGAKVSFKLLQSNLDNLSNTSSIKSLNLKTVCNNTGNSTKKLKLFIRKNNNDYKSSELNVPLEYPNIISYNFEKDPSNSQNWEMSDIYDIDVGIEVV